MNSKLLLHLVLKAAGVDPSIRTPNDRMRLQKAIYLIQAAGLNLGYSYGWYLRGPYSPDLTKVYYDADGDTSIKEDVGKWTLSPAAETAVNRAKYIFTPPGGKSQEEWLEALASLHFLRTNFPPLMAQEKLSSQKKHLEELVPFAEQALKNVALL